MQTQKIGSIDLQAAAQALGGAPVRPPALAQQAAAAAAPPPPAAAKMPATGNPTFDPTPPAVLRRRNAVEQARSGLQALVGNILSSAGRIRAELEILAEDSAESLSAEAFDPVSAGTFLDGLATLISGLSAAAPPAPAAPAKAKANSRTANDSAPPSASTPEA